MDPELHGRIDDVDPLDHKRLKNVGDMHQSKTIMILSQNIREKEREKGRRVGTRGPGKTRDEKGDGDKECEKSGKSYH